LQIINSGFQVASNVNQTFLNEMRYIRGWLDSNQKAYNDSCDVIRARLDALEARMNDNGNLLYSMASATSPEETEESQDAANRVIDVPDLDHADI
jgi:Arc/MetJ-type ribon-helix-helix transcriptional regulator